MIPICGPSAFEQAGNNRSRQCGPHSGRRSQFGLDLPHIVEGGGHPLVIVHEGRASGRTQCMAAVSSAHLGVESGLGFTEQANQPALLGGIGASIENRPEEAPNQVDQRFNTARG